MNYNNIIKEYLYESGIRIPSNTHAAKILFHKDLDGFFSALLTYNQLVKQGIPKQNITFHGVQYGDEETEMEAKLKNKKGQMISVVDFSSLPVLSIYDTLNRATSYKLKPNIFKRFVNKLKEAKFEDEKSVEIAKSLTTNLDTERFLKGLRFVKKFDLDKIPENETEDNLKKITLVKTEEPDFVSDHHDNSADNLTKGKSGSIGKTEYKSDTEHISIAYAPNIMGHEDIKAVSVVDSAGYSNLMDTLTLPTNFKSKGRIERVATVLNTLIPDLLKRNETAIHNVIRSSQPSLVSVYNNVLKYSKLNNLQNEAFIELSKEKPDWNKIDNIRNQLPKNMAKETGKDNEKPGETYSLEKWREKGKRDLENATKGSITGQQKRRIEELQAKKDKTEEEKDELKKLLAIKEQRSGKFYPVKNIAMRQDATSTKRYPSRFTGALLQDKEGSRWGILVKRFNTMLQFSVNPELPEEKKKYRFNIRSENYYTKR